MSVSALSLKITLHSIRLMTDMPRFLRAVERTLRYGNPTDVWMNEENFPNGRYLMDEEHNEDPYGEQALLHGQRQIRDGLPLPNDTSKRMAAPEFIKEEAKLQKEAETCAAEGLVEGKEWWLRIKLARGTSNIDKLPKKNVLWNVLRYLKENKGIMRSNTMLTRAINLRTTHLLHAQGPSDQTQYPSFDPKLIHTCRKFCRIKATNTRVACIVHSLCILIYHAHTHYHVSIRTRTCTCLN